MKHNIDFNSYFKQTIEQLNYGCNCCRCFPCCCCVGPPGPPGPPGKPFTSGGYFTNPNDEVTVASNDPIPLTTNLIYGTDIVYNSPTDIQIITPGLYLFIWTVTATNINTDTGRGDINLVKNSPSVSNEIIGKSAGFENTPSIVLEYNGSCLNFIDETPTLIQLINEPVNSINLSSSGISENSVSAQLTIARLS